ncbi:serine protease [Shimia biformata]|uniref:serine protease n=1 Tax=Shimia biformata TaxID=1294299 RepID=UPI001951E2AB|nr:serine protease [Shimia biformata]
MTRIFWSFIFSILLWVGAASAQEDTAFVQIEAQPSLTIATERAQLYGTDLQDVNGFSMGGGWYAIALGPFSRADAENVLQVYTAERIIPRDAFITTQADYQSQFWPVGANVLNGVPASVPDTTVETTGVIETGPRPADETVREARDSEAALTREERMELQVWLQWAGFYNSSIDGAFGRGTRGSMAAWQEANNYEPTGVLTTGQRAELRAQYFAVLEGMDLRRVSDLTAGIEMLVPMGAVSQGATEFPFVHFDATGTVPGAKVLMISQAGDRNTLFGLYDIMQTLEIVPLNGERERGKDSFLLTGSDGRIVSHTEVTLDDGRIKGFTLVWPAGDEERRSRILSEMKASFTRIDGVLDPAAGSNAAQDINLLAGLEIRRPKLSRSGFFADASGMVVTTAEAVASCQKITVETDFDAEIAALDEASGIAVLRPKQQLAPMGVAGLLLGEARLQSDVAVAGYSFEGALGAPTLTFGTLADVKGLNGEPGLKRLALNALPGDAGGPVLDAGGSVLGMLLPESAAGRQLPADVRFAAGSDAIIAALEAAGVQPEAAQSAGAMAPEDLTTLASGMTVLVSCW